MSQIAKKRPKGGYEQLRTLSETTGCFSILQGWPHEEPPDYAEALMRELAQPAATTVAFGIVRNSA
jgi:hypothetical protein